MADEVELYSDAMRAKVAELVMGQYLEAETHWTAMRGRQLAIRALVKGEWNQVFTEDFATDQDLPQVANSFRKHTEDIGHMFGQQSPTEMVPPDGPDEEPALKRERVLVSYNSRSRFADQLEYFGMDIAAGAYAAIKVWPEKRRTDRPRYPMFTRLDPICVLPSVAYDPVAPTDDVFVHGMQPWSRLAAQFPVQMARLRDRCDEHFRQGTYDATIREQVYDVKNPMVRTVDFYSTHALCRLAVIKGESQAIYELLVYKLNDTEICPVQIAYRPSWAEEPLGQLDDSKGIVRGKHRSWVMLMEYFVQMVYGGKLTWNVSNPTERGPNVTYRALSPDAFMKPITPESPAFQALQMLALQDQEERLTQVRPAAREGEAPVNKATAAFLTRSQGELTDVVKSMYKNFGAAKQAANEAAFEQDVRWCGGKDKKIYGIARGRRFAETYTPADDIGEETASVVTYGPVTGLDLPTQRVMDQNSLQLGAMSRETYLERDPATTEPHEELARISAEAIEMAFIAGLQQPNTPIEARIAALRTLKGGGDILAILDATAAAQRQAQQQTLPDATGGAPSPEGGAPNPLGSSGAAGAEGANVPLPSAELLRSGVGRR